MVVETIGNWEEVGQFGVSGGWSIFPVGLVKEWWWLEGLSNGLGVCLEMMSVWMMWRSTSIFNNPSKFLESNVKFIQQLMGSNGLKFSGLGRLLKFGE